MATQQLLALPINIHSLLYRENIMRLSHFKFDSISVFLGVISTLLLVGCGGGGSSATPPAATGNNVNVAANSGTISVSGDSTLPSSIQFSLGIEDPAKPGDFVWAATNITLSIAHDAATNADTVTLLYVAKNPITNVDSNYAWQKIAAAGITKDAAARTVTFTNTAIPGVDITTGLGNVIALKTTATINGTVKY